MTRRLSTFVALALAVLSVTAAVAAPGARTGAPVSAFLLTGGGWGHGVGMSQWGAYGQAKEGRTYRQILAHYYQGTEIGPSPVKPGQSVRVLVADGQASVTVGSTKPMVVRDGLGAEYDLPAGPITIGPTLQLPAGEDGKRLALSPPVTLRPTKGGLLSWGGKAYRGELRLLASAKAVQLVNVVPLETYLLGVVPGEMPKDWPLEALKAQAVAARTYAIANLVKGKPFDLYSDWRSQVYYGAASEALGTTQAVKETRGEILTFGGAPVTTFYFSSSGGRTASALDVFGSDLPYLVAVDDPWDSASPHHVWEPRTFTPAGLAKAFGLGGAVLDARLVPGKPGAPARLALTTRTGVQEIRITDVRARLGLKSSSFRLGMVSLAGAETPAVPAGAVALAGVVRDAPGTPVLQRRTPQGTWVKAGARLTLAPDGAFTVLVRPSAATAFRIVAGALVSPPFVVRLPVAA